LYFHYKFFRHFSGREFPRPDDRVRGPAGAAQRPRDADRARRAALAGLDGVGQAAARAQRHHSQSGYEGPVWRFTFRRGLYSFFLFQDILNSNQTYAHYIKWSSLEEDMH
jgi:hypothetical protein